MAFLLSGERPGMPAATLNPFRAISSWLSDRRAKRAQRAALSSLLDFDAALLEDLGIERQDVLEVLRRPQTGAGETLAARRAETSRNWLSHR